MAKETTTATQPAPETVTAPVISAICEIETCGREDEGLKANLVKRGWEFYNGQAFCPQCSNAI